MWAPLGQAQLPLHFTVPHQQLNHQVENKNILVGMDNISIDHNINTVYYSAKKLPQMGIGHTDNVTLTAQCQ